MNIGLILVNMLVGKQLKVDFSMVMLVMMEGFVMSKMERLDLINVLPQIE